MKLTEIGHQKKGRSLISAKPLIKRQDSNGNHKDLRFCIIQLIPLPLPLTPYFSYTTDSPIRPPNMSTRLQRALATIDAAHSEDPSKTTLDGIEKPYELHYAERCTHHLTARAPNASEVLQLAVRAQHLKRWEIPRASYPMTRPGYHAWRTFLKKRQGELAAQMCLEAGYSEEETRRIAALVRKEDLKVDEETKALEDVACLVFLEDQFEEFEQTVDEEKIIGILRKTWAKMSEEGRRLALEMKMEGRPKELIEKALAG